MSFATPTSFASDRSARVELVRPNSAPGSPAASFAQEASSQPLITADGSIRWHPSTANALAVEPSSSASTPALKYTDPSAHGIEFRQRPGSAPSSMSAGELLDHRPHTALPTLDSTLYTPNLDIRPFKLDDMDCFKGRATEAHTSYQNQTGQAVSFAFSVPSTAGPEEYGQDQTSTGSIRAHTLSSDTTLIGSDSLASIHFGDSDVGKFNVNGHGEHVAMDMTQLLTGGESSLMQVSTQPTSDVHLTQSFLSQPKVTAASSSQAIPSTSPSFEQMDFDHDSEMDEDEDEEDEDASDQEGSSGSDASSYIPQFSVFGPIRPDLNPLLNSDSAPHSQRQFRSSERSTEQSRNRLDSATSRKAQGGADRTTRNMAATARHHASSVLGGAGHRSVTRRRASSDTKKVASDNMSTSVISSILGTQASSHLRTQSLGHGYGVSSSESASEFQSPDFASHPEAQAALQQLRDLADKNRSTAEGRLRVPFLERFAEKWMSCFYEEDEEGTVNRAFMNESYRTMCRTFGLRPLNPSSFGRLVRTHFPRILTRRLGPRGNSRYHYTGLSAKFLSGDEGDDSTASRRGSLAAARAQRKSVTQLTKELSSVRADRHAPLRAASSSKSSAPVVPSSVRPSAAILTGSQTNRRPVGQQSFAQQSFASTPQGQNVAGLPSIGVGSMTPSPSYSNAQLGSSGPGYTPLLLSSPVLTSEGQMIPFGNVSMQGRTGISSYPSEPAGISRMPSSQHDEMSLTLQSTPSMSSVGPSSSSSAGPSIGFDLHGGMNASMFPEQQHRLHQTRSMPFPSSAQAGGQQFGNYAAPGNTTMIVAPSGFAFDVMGLQGVNSMMELASAAMSSIPGFSAGAMAHLQQCGPAAVAASMMIPSPISWPASLSAPHTDNQAGPAF